MIKKLVGLFRGRFAIVPRHGHLDVRWNHSALERLHPAQDIVSDGDRIGSRSLSHSKGNSGFIGKRHTASRAPAEEDILGRLFCPVQNLSNLPQIDGFALKNADHDISGILGTLQKSAGFHRNLLVIARDSTRSELAVRLP